MNTKYNEMRVSGLVVQIVRKNIKHLHLGVYPPEGRVRVAVPLHVNDTAIRMAVIRRLSWIRKHQARFIAQSRQEKREMVSGESHYFLGQRYRLRVIERNEPAKVEKSGHASLTLFVRPGISSDKRLEVLHQWYRQQLRILVPHLLEKWLPRMNLHMPDWRIKRMKTKWGSCNRKFGRIWLNLELAKKPVACIEYVLVHELVHFHEQHHNDRFIELMNRYLPSWRIRKAELNRTPLSHERWDY